MSIYIIIYLPFKIQSLYTKRGCRISKYFCWAAALLSAQNGIEISYGSDAIL